MTTPPTKTLTFEISPEVRACPFCGGWNLSWAESDHSDSEAQMWIRCEDCWATGPDGTTPTDVVNQWNERKEPAPPPK